MTTTRTPAHAPWCRYTFTAHVGTNGDFEFDVVVHATSFSAAKAQAVDIATHVLDDTDGDGDGDLNRLSIMRVEVIHE